MYKYRLAIVFPNLATVEVFSDFVTMPSLLAETVKELDSISAAWRLETHMLNGGLVSKLMSDQLDPDWRSGHKL